VSTPGSSTPGEALRPRARALAFALSWCAFFLASPGILSREGSALLAVAALVPWAWAAARPGRAAFWIEWALAGAGIAATCFWSTKVLWITLLVVAIVPGLYVALAGVVLRRIAGGLPLALAAPVAWVALETLRAVIDPPFAFGWMRVGHHAHAVDWLAGSARVWGVAGLSFVLVALAGGIVDLTRIRATRADEGASATGRARRGAIALVLALGPSALALAAGLATAPPETTTGPRVLLVQPAFEQHRKMEPLLAATTFRETVELTERGILEARRAGEREIELVAWGEGMLPYSIADAELRRDFERGARSPEWSGTVIDAADLARFETNEREAIQGLLFGRSGRRILPEGASLICGVDLFGTEAGEIRRWNAVAAWGPDGARAGWVSKQHLVPGAESLCGLEQLAWVRALAFDLSGYVPDLATRAEPRVLELPRRGGGVWRVGATVCFDNTFEGPYARPLRAGPVDFHLVCSNEAWYEDSWEYDQMLAFSRLLAIATGRSVVRATNAGISTVLGVDGREVGRLEVDGRDRMVSGTLRADVEVPVRDERTPFVVAERGWIALWVALPLGCWALGRRRLQRRSPPVGAAA